MGLLVDHRGTRHRCALRQADPRELSGSTLAVTSLGQLGGIVTTPVINHLKVAILSINRIVARPMVRDGMVQVRQMMNLSLSFDHRVVDGQKASRCVQALRSEATLGIDLSVRFS